MKYVVAKVIVTHDNDRFYHWGAVEVTQIICVTEDQDEARRKALEIAPLFPTEQHGKKDLEGIWTRVYELE